MEIENPSNGGEIEGSSSGFEVDSCCSTPYVSAPSSTGRGPVPSYFFSAPASPMHYVLASTAFSSSTSSSVAGEGEVEASISGSFEFEFSARGSMISADEIFLNGQIRPMRLASHLQRPQALAPLIDGDEDDDEDDHQRDGVEADVRGRDLRLRSGSVHRRARSMSPLRNSRFQWVEDEDEQAGGGADLETDPDLKQIEIETMTPSSASASSSRSSSSGRNSKRWIFLKDLLYRSKSEGRGKEKEKEKFWHSISFSPSSSSSSSSKEKDKSKPPTPSPPSPSSDKPKPNKPATKKTATASRRPSAHERLYTSNRAVSEDMRRRTFLPYRQGLLGCLGLSSRGYGAVSGLAKTLNPVSSR